MRLDRYCHTNGDIGPAWVEKEGIGASIYDLFALDRAHCHKYDIVYSGRLPRSVSLWFPDRTECQILR